MQSVVTNKLKVKMKVDTGAQCNGLPELVHCTLTQEKKEVYHTTCVISILATRYQYYERYKIYYLVKLQVNLKTVLVEKKDEILGFDLVGLFQLAS